MARAAIDSGLTLRGAECRPGAAVVELSPVGAPPLRIEVAEPPGAAFAHAGRLRVSPIVEVEDFAQLPKPQRDGFESLLAWLGTHERDVVLATEGAPPVVRRTMSFLGIRWVGPWLLVAALALTLAATIRRPAFSAEGRWDVICATAVGVSALVLRFALGVWGPFHVNGQGPLWISGATNDPSALASSGPGYREVFYLIARLGSASPDVPIFAANSILSAAIAPLAFAIGRRLGLDRFRALIPAIALCVDPASIVCATTESYLPSILFLTVAAQLLFVVADGYAANSKPRAVALVAAGALLCAQAARIHPVAWVPVALTPLIVLSTPGPIRQRLLRSVAVAAVVASLLALTSGDVVAERIGEAMRHSAGVRFSSSVLVSGVLLVGWFLLAKPRSSMLPAAAQIGFLLLTRGAFSLSAASQAGYDRLFETIPLVLLAALLPEHLARRRTVQAGIALALGFLFLRSAPMLRVRTTEQLEYRWVRSLVADLPPSCRLAAVGRAGDRVLALPVYSVVAEGGSAVLNISGQGDLQRARKSFECVHYLRGSICSTVEGREICDAAERDVSIVESTRQEFPSVPSRDRRGYDAPSVTDVAYVVK